METALRPLLVMSFRKMHGVFVSFRRCIQMEYSQRKGKISIVRRKFLNTEDKSYEVLELKESSSVMKRMNLENKNLFGNIVASVKETCCSFRKKKKSARLLENPQKSEILDAQYIVPIRDVKPSVESCELPNQSNIPNSSNSRDIITSIVDFPLTNVVDESNEKYIDKLNYLRQHISSLCGSSLPSITSILENTMPPERVAILEKWKSNMIKKMGLDNFTQYQQDLLNHGSSLHNTINMYLSGTPESKLVIEPYNNGHWLSLRHLLPLVKDVKLLEEHVVHPFLCYHGIVDCYASYKNNFVVVDWKTSEKFKPSLSSTFDSPLQIAAYAGALNFDPRLNYKANQGLIVIAYKNGNPSSAHYMDKAVLLNYWKQWLKRLKCYWENVESSNNSNK